MFDRVTSAGMVLGRQFGLQNMQGELAVLTGEVASGKKADPARALGVGASVLYKLYDDVQQGGAVQNATIVAGKRLETMQVAMASIGSLLGGVAAAGLQSATEGSPLAGSLLANQARDAMATMATLLNTQMGGQSVFGGSDSAAPAMRPSAAPGGPLAAIRGLVTGPVDRAGVDQLLGAVDAVFTGTSATATYQGTFYASASRTEDPASRIRIGAGETLDYNLRGDHPGFKDGMQALSLLSLLDARDPVSGAELLDGDARAAVRGKANSLLAAAQDKLTGAAGLLGVKQERLQTVSDIQGKAIAAATAQISSMEGADYYAASERINALKLQLQATYSLTATLSGLSLTNYLK